MKTYPLAMVVALFLFLFTAQSANVALAQQIKTVSMSAYIPSSGGEINELKLFSQPPKTGACPPGTLYFRNDTNTLEVCDGTDYKPISGIWSRNTSLGNVFLANPTDNVGLNTSNPAAKLHIHQGDLLIDEPTSNPILTYAGVGPLFYYYPDTMIFRNVQKVTTDGTFLPSFWGDFSWATGFDVIASGESSFIGNGVMNTAGGLLSAVVNGTGNNITAGGINSTIGGGLANAINTQYSFIGGGHTNMMQGNYGTIAGGTLNDVLDGYGFVGGGSDNNVNIGGRFGAIVGGTGNNLAGRSAAIGGGEGNTAGGNYSTVGGGISNAVNAMNATVSGGDNNRVNAVSATIAGGSDNLVGVGASGAFIVGQNNTVTGVNGVAIGSGLNVSGDGSIAIGNGSTTVSQDNKIALVGGNVGVRKNNPQTALDVGGVIKFGPTSAPIYATGAPGYRYQIQAHINPSGGIIRGDGTALSINKLGIGHYRVNYFEPFDPAVGPPIVVASLVGDVPGYSIMVMNMTLTTVEIKIYDSTLTAIDNEFTFRVSGFPDNAGPYADVQQ